MECFSAGAVFLFALPCGQRSWESYRLFPFGIVLSGCGDGLNLVDFYRVSLAARDGVCHTDLTDNTVFSVALCLRVLFEYFAI